MSGISQAGFYPRRARTRVAVLKGAASSQGGEFDSKDTTNSRMAVVPGVQSIGVQGFTTVVQTCPYARVSLLYVGSLPQAWHVFCHSPYLTPPIASPTSAPTTAPPASVPPTPMV